MINPDFAKLITTRIACDDSIFFTDLHPVSTVHGVDIVRRKKLFGIMQSGQTRLRPIFDTVEVASADVALVKLKDYYALYSIADGSSISDFEYVDYEIRNGLIQLQKHNGRSELFELDGCRYIHRGEGFDKFNILVSSTEYLWAHRNGSYSFIHRRSGRVVSPPAVILPYDTAVGIWGLDEHNRIAAFDDNGSINESILRKCVLKNGGYLTLSNYTEKIEHTIDIYGNILNN